MKRNAALAFFVFFITAAAFILAQETPPNGEAPPASDGGTYGGGIPPVPGGGEGALIPGGDAGNNIPTGIPGAPGGDAGSNPTNIPGAPGGNLGGSNIPTGIPEGGSPSSGGVSGGPGGCTSPQECDAYCASNPEACRGFEEGSGGGAPPGGIPGGFGGIGSGANVSSTSGGTGGGAGPGGCTSQEECDAYCASNPQECSGFGGSVPSGAGNGTGVPGFGGPQNGGAPGFGGSNSGAGGGTPGFGPQGGSPQSGFGGPQGSSPRKPPKKERKRPEGKGPPTTIPPEIKEAGASQEFIDMMCAMARYNSKRFVSATEAAEQHFMQLSGDLEIDASKLQALRQRIESRAEDVCNANEANFGSAVKAFMNEMEGPDGMEGAMNDVGNQIEMQMQAKAEKMQEEIQPKTQRMEEIRQQIQEIDAIERDVASAGASADALQIYEDQKKQLYVEMQQLSSEMQASGTEMRQVGQKLETVFGGLEQKMNEQFSEQSGEHAAFKMQMAEKQMALFTKVFDVQVDKVKTKKKQLEEEGLDASVFDELVSWMESKKSEAQTVFYSGKEEDMEKFMNGMDGSRGTWETKIDAAISPQIEAKIEKDWSETKPKILEGIRLAKENGVDTSDIEKTISEIEALQTQYKALQGEQKMAAYGKAKAKFEQLREEWIVLRDELEAIASEEEA